MPQIRASTPALRIASEDPEAKETLLPVFNSWTTPNESFYVRSHFSDVPEIDPATYRLAINGAVRTSLSLSYEALMGMPAEEIPVTMECAGNSRTSVYPPAEGLQFNHGAVGTAVWKGIPLASLLARAGVDGSAVEVLFEGADSGEEEEEGEELHISYERSLPLKDALDPGVLVAFEMNRQPLEPSHGFPIRLIVPGWYGMASVKWLTRITLLREPFKGFFQGRRYVYISEGETASTPWEPVSRLVVKSLITEPRHGEVIPRGRYVVRGTSWTGSGEVSRVEVSIDGGRTWGEAELVGERAGNAWRQWEYPCELTTPGHFILMAKATDSKGNTQPLSSSWNFRGYAYNGVHRVAVEVPPAGAG